MESKKPFHLVKKVKTHHDFMWDYTQLFVKTLVRPAMIFLVFLGLTVTCIFALLIYWAEGGGANPQITSYFDAVFFAVSTITTVGFGDIVPKTLVGRIICMFMMFIGTGLFVAFTAIVSSTIMTIEQQDQLNKKSTTDE